MRVSLRLSEANGVCLSDDHDQVIVSLMHEGCLLARAGVRVGMELVAVGPQLIRSQLNAAESEAVIRHLQLATPTALINLEFSITSRQSNRRSLPPEDNQARTKTARGRPSTCDFNELSVSSKEPPESDCKPKQFASNPHSLQRGMTAPEVKRSPRFLIGPPAISPPSPWSASAGPLAVAVASTGFGLPVPDMGGSQRDERMPQHLSKSKATADEWGTQKGAQTATAEPYQQQQQRHGVNNRNTSKLRHVVAIPLRPRLPIQSESRESVRRANGASSSSSSPSPSPRGVVTQSTLESRLDAAVLASKPASPPQLPARAKRRNPDRSTSALAPAGANKHTRGGMGRGKGGTTGAASTSISASVRRPEPSLTHAVTSGAYGQTQAKVSSRATTEGRRRHGSVDRLRGAARGWVELGHATGLPASRNQSMPRTINGGATIADGPQSGPHLIGSHSSAGWYRRRTREPAQLRSQRGVGHGEDPASPGLSLQLPSPDSSAVPSRSRLPPSDSHSHSQIETAPSRVYAPLVQPAHLYVQPHAGIASAGVPRIAQTQSLPVHAFDGDYPTATPRRRLAFSELKERPSGVAAVMTRIPGHSVGHPPDAPSGWGHGNALHQADTLSYASSNSARTGEGLLSGESRHWRIRQLFG